MDGDKSSHHLVALLAESDWISLSSLYNAHLYMFVRKKMYVLTVRTHSLSKTISLTLSLSQKFQT